MSSKHLCFVLTYRPHPEKQDVTIRDGGEVNFDIDDVVVVFADKVSNTIVCFDTYLEPTTEFQPIHCILDRLQKWCKDQKFCHWMDSGNWRAPMVFTGKDLRLEFPAEGEVTAASLLKSLKPLGVLVALIAFTGAWLVPLKDRLTALQSHLITFSKTSGRLPGK